MKRHASELKAERMRESANELTRQTQTISVRLKVDEIKTIDTLCERLGISRSNFFRFCFMAGLEELNDLNGKADLNKYVSESKTFIDMEEEYLNDSDPVRRLIANRFAKLLGNKKK